MCCPLTDHLVGTYVKQSDWLPKVRPRRVLDQETEGGSSAVVTLTQTPQIEGLLSVSAVETTTDGLIAV